MTAIEQHARVASSAPETTRALPRPVTKDVASAAARQMFTRPVRSFSVRRAATVLGAWVLVTLAGLGLVVYGLGLLFAQRDQRALLSTYRTAVYDASNATPSLGGATTAPTLPPVPGSAVGILQIGALHLQQVVVEGVSPGETEQGPGHVPGTAGLGQPGNAAVVARRAGFGGPFAHLQRLRRGDRILVTTTQGQSVYQITQVANTTLYPGAVTPAAVSSASGLSDSFTQTTTTTITAPSKIGLAVAIDELYAPSTQNRLTLVTSASGWPWNTGNATVVIAKLLSEPFAATPQESRSDSQAGNSGTSGAWPAVVLALLGYLALAVGALALYRRVSHRVAYLVTIVPLLALIVLLAQTMVQLLPAWL